METIITHAKLPQLPEEQNRAKKLFEKQKPQLLKLREQGYTYKQLAEIFKISESTISYWVKGPEYRKERNKASTQRHIKNNYKQTKAQIKEINKHKRATLGSTIYNNYQKEYRKEHPEKMATYHKTYYDKNTEKCNKSSKEWHEKNKEGRKRKDHEYYNKNKETIKTKRKEKAQINKPTTI